MCYVYLSLFINRNDHGGKMPKIPLNITVDKDVLEKFKELCENNDVKISTKINTLMKDWLEDNAKEK